MNKWIEVQNCPVCNSGAGAFIPYQVSTKVGFEHEYYGTLAPSGVVVKYVQCVQCGMVFQSPRMSDEDIDKFYSSGDYMKSIISPTQTLEDIEQTEYNRAIRIANYIKDSGFIIHHNFLDVGCGKGYLMEEVDKLFSCEVSGVNPDADYAEPTVGIIYSELNIVPGKYGMIACIHVLEHISNPIDFLKDMADRLIPEGKIIIEVPSAQSQGGPLRIPHVLFFHPWTLNQALLRVGLKMLRISFTPDLLVVAEKI